MWRQEELSRINATTSGPERKAALCALLEQEAQLIASIGRHRLEAGKQNKEDQMKKFLDAVSDRCVFCVISNLEIFGLAWCFWQTLLQHFLAFFIGQSAIKNIALKFAKITIEVQIFAELPVSLLVQCREPQDPIWYSTRTLKAQFGTH